MTSVFSYWFHRYLRTWRGTIVISVANPLLFLIGIGAGLGHLIDRHVSAGTAGPAGVSYAAFFAPGLLAASAMQTAFLESSYRVVEAASPQGAYLDAAPTPVDPEQIMAGHQLFIAFRVLTASAAFVIVMAAFGLVPVGRAPGVLAAATLTGLAFSTPAAAWMVGVRTQREANNIARMVIMPLYMFSGTFFALSQLPAAVRYLIEALPLAQGAELCRDLALGTADAATALRAAYLAACAVAGFALARRTYRRRLHP